MERAETISGVQMSEISGSADGRGGGGDDTRRDHQHKVGRKLSLCKFNNGDQRIHESRHCLNITGVHSASAEIVWATKMWSIRIVLMFIHIPSDFKRWSGVNRQMSPLHLSGVDFELCSLG